MNDERTEPSDQEVDVSAGIVQTLNDIVERAGDMYDAMREKAAVGNGRAAAYARWCSDAYRNFWLWSSVYRDAIVKAMNDKGIDLQETVYEIFGDDDGSETCFAWNEQTNQMDVAT